ncbi:MAG: flotillin-like FloA family protein [Bacteroidota bacterium]
MIALPMALFLGTSLALLGIVIYPPLRSYWAIRNSGLRFPFRELFFMQIRKTCRRDIVNNWIQLHQGDLPVAMAALEVHLLAKGNVSTTTRALLLAKEKGIPYTFQQLAAMDLRGDDVVKHVRLMS